MEIQILTKFGSPKPWSPPPCRCSMDHFELLKITEGKNRKQSLVFHIVDHQKEKHYELLIDHVCQNTFCFCWARYTVIFGDKIKELIVLNEDKSKKDYKKKV